MALLPCVTLTLPSFFLNSYTHAPKITKNNSNIYVTKKHDNNKRMNTFLKGLVIILFEKSEKSITIKFYSHRFLKKNHRYWICARACSLHLLLLLILYCSCCCCRLNGGGLAKMQMNPALVWLGLSYQRAVFHSFEHWKRWWRRRKRRRKRDRLRSTAVARHWEESDVFDWNAVRRVVDGCFILNL